MLNMILSEKVLKILIVILVILFLYAIFNSFTKQKFHSKSIKTIRDKKNKTIRSMLNNIIKYFLIIVGLIMILNILGVNTNSLLASLGVVSAIIALAFQDIVKDFLAGISIISENQYDIGDTVTINGFRGEVISVGLRTTKLKSYKGEIYFVANHNIDQVINHSLAKNLAIVNVDVSYDSDLDKVEKVLNELCTKLKEEVEDIRGNVKINGIEELGASGITYQIIAEVLPVKNFEVQRIMRREIKKAFDKNKIEIPYQQVVIHNDWL